MSNITQEMNNDFMENLIKKAEKMDKDNPVQACSIDNPECENCGS